MQRMYDKVKQELNGNDLWFHVYFIKVTFACYVVLPPRCFVAEPITTLTSFIFS